MDNVTRKTAETERDFAGEIEEGACSDQDGADDQEGAAEVASGVHGESLTQSGWLGGGEDKARNSRFIAQKPRDGAEDLASLRDDRFLVGWICLPADSLSGEEWLEEEPDRDEVGIVRTWGAAVLRPYEELLRSNEIDESSKNESIDQPTRR
jgi:hypothetical protein